MWKRITDWLAFTKTEQNVLLFLVGAFVLGSGIQLFRSDRAGISWQPPASTDSIFAERSAAGAGSDLPFPINVNSASKDDLIALPGIGEVTAERIIMARKERGRFGSVDDLLSVKGITRKKLDQLKPLITVE
jgi:competence protein ComEA